jgi:hypothetical protein
MIVEKQMECRLAGGTEVLGENLPQRHFCPSQNPALSDPGLNPGCHGEKPATNRLSYVAALCEIRGRRSGNASGFSPTFFGLLLIIFIPQLLHAHLSSFLEVCGNPEQATQYHFIVL